MAQIFLDIFPLHLTGKETKSKLLSAEVKNSRVILQIVLPLLAKALFLKEFCKNWQNNPQNNLAIFHFGPE